MAKRVLIAGGTGLLGKHVMDRLLTEGHEVRILTRNQKKAKQKDFYHYDLENDQIEKQAFDQIDVLINLAGANVIEKPWTKDRKRLLYSSRVNLNHFLLRVVEETEQRPKVFISASAIGIYGDRANEQIAENSDPGSGNFIVELCKDWERSADGFKKAGARVVQARISNVLAKSDGFFPKVMESTKFGVLPVLGSGEQFISWIHIDDLAELVLHCIDNQSIDGPVNFCTRDAVRYRDLIGTIKKVKGKKWVSPKVPKMFLKTLMGERSHLLFDSLRCVPQRAMDSGFIFNYPNLHSAIESL